MTTQLQRNDDSLSTWDQVGPFSAPARQHQFGAFERTPALSNPELSGIQVSPTCSTQPLRYSGERSVALSPWGQFLLLHLQEIETYPLNAFSAGHLTSRTLSSSDLSGPEKLDSRQRRFHDAVLDSITAEPVEDGYSHAAEVILKQAIDSDAERAAKWIRSLILDRRHPAVAAAVFRCLERLDNPLTEEWRASLVAEALASPDVEVRDAAAQAVELWEDERSYGVLRQHNETEPWLRTYIEEVLHDVRE